MHAGAPRRFLHPGQLDFLIVELILELRDAPQLPHLRLVVGRLVLHAPAGRAHRFIQLVNSHLERGHPILLCQNQSLPLICRPLFGQALLC